MMALFEYINSYISDGILLFNCPDYGFAAVTSYETYVTSPDCVLSLRMLYAMFPSQDTGPGFIYADFSLKSDIGLKFYFEIYLEVYLTFIKTSVVYRGTNCRNESVSMPVFVDKLL